MNSASDHEQLRSLIGRSGRLLDEHRFSDYVDLFADDGSYAITAKAPELPEPMVWMAQSRRELAQLFESIPSHEWDLGERLHLIAPGEIDIVGDRATAVSAFCIYRIDGDGRQDAYVSGRYDDSWIRTAGGWKLANREARVANRLWRAPSPIPV